ncbi:hypothetical protein BLNAU_1319 [Blattamonas nauphoetae]|uniref:Uncharacterized protein n=1 Tax=Blattamonas nauphoetae TaxID=2049346 RepID=A0ABQ9YJ17_9EUKA|nr:hypothetical protein BLNAU_1319 [Blattamonas nauphoetae]
MKDDISFKCQTEPTNRLHSPHTDEMFASDRESFLILDPNSDLTFVEKSAIFCSLVALVEVEYPFDNTFEDRGALFLKNLEPEWGDEPLATKLVTELVPSSAGSASGFVASITTLLSSPHSTVVAAALSLLHRTIMMSSREIRCRLVESDLVSTVLATVQPHALPITGNYVIISNLHYIVERCILLADQENLTALDITATVDVFNHREMIFRKVVIPSSQFITFLISNRHVLNGDLFHSFFTVLTTFLQICSFHRPTLEFVLASPVVMGFSSCLLSIENNFRLLNTIHLISFSFKEWMVQDSETVQSAKRMIQTLISEGFEDTLEQIRMNAYDGYFGAYFVKCCLSLSQLLGSNVRMR